METKGLLPTECTESIEPTDQVVSNGHKTGLIPHAKPAWPINTRLTTEAREKVERYFDTHGREDPTAESRHGW